MDVANVLIGYSYIILFGIMTDFMMIVVQLLSTMELLLIVSPDNINIEIPNKIVKTSLENHECSFELPNINLNNLAFDFC